MTYFDFDDKNIKKDFYQIAKQDNNSRRIDSEQEKRKLSEYLSGLNQDTVSSHDIALLRAGTLNFINSDVKKAYRNITKTNNNTTIDTKREYELLKDYYNTHKDNLCPEDETLLRCLLNSYNKITININGNNNNISIGNSTVEIHGDVYNGSGNLAIGSGNHQIQDNSQPTPGNEENIDNIVTEELPENNSERTEEVTEETPVKADYREIKITNNDTWYKIVKENYITSSNQEVMDIVQNLKNEYYEANKSRLIKQGHTSSKSNFFYDNNEVMKLPTSIEIKGKVYTLK